MKSVFHSVKLQNSDALYIETAIIQPSYVQIFDFINSLTVSPVLLFYYPTALKGCRGIVFTHGVRMGWRLGGRREKFVRPVSQEL